MAHFAVVYKKCQFLFLFQVQLLPFLSLNLFGFDPELEAGSRPLYSI
jgi:hypothetical protein